MFVCVWTNCSFRQNTIIHIENSSRKCYCLCPFLVQNKHNDLLETTRKKLCRHTSTHISIPMPVSIPPESSWVSANKPHIPAALVRAMEGLCWGHQLETAELHLGKGRQAGGSHSSSALTRAAHKQRQGAEAMKEQLVSNSWHVLNWYWNRRVSPRSKGLRNSDFPSWERARPWGTRGKGVKTLCQRNIACSAKGRTAEFCCAIQRTGVLWHWLTCLFMGLTFQSCPKGLFMERAIFTACRSPGGAGAPVTVLSQVPTDSHHKYQKQGLAEISVAKATFQTAFQASSDFLTTQTTCLLTIPANIHLTLMPCTDICR